MSNINRNPPAPTGPKPAPPPNPPSGRPKVEEALGVLEGAERSFVVLQQLVVMVNANADYIAAANEVRAARNTLAAHIAQQDTTIARLTELVYAIGKCSYPVCTSIDPRGHRWSEAYLDKLRPVILAATLNRGEVK